MDWQTLFRKIGPIGALFIALIAFVCTGIIWLLAHATAAPGHQVKVAFGLVEYTKKGIGADDGASARIADEQTSDKTTTADSTANEIVDDPPTLATAVGASNLKVPESDVLAILTGLQGKTTLEQQEIEEHFEGRAVKTLAKIEDVAKFNQEGILYGRILTEVGEPTKYLAIIDLPESADPKLFRVGDVIWATGSLSRLDSHSISFDATSIQRK